MDVNELRAKSAEDLEKELLLLEEEEDEASLQDWN